MRELKGTIIISANAISKAAEIVGSEKILAAKIGVRRQKLNYWKLNALLPLEKAIEVFTATGGQVSLYELRPDCKRSIKEFLILLFRKNLMDKHTEISEKLLRTLLNNI